MIQTHHKQLSPSQKSSLVDKKLAEYKSMALSSLSAAKQNLIDSGETLTRKAEPRREQDASRSLEKRRSMEEASGSRSRDPPLRKSHTVHRGETIAAPPPPTDPKPVRQNAAKGIEEALKARVKGAPDVEADDEKIRELAKVIESQLFRLYNRDAGPKYKNKYRSIVFNIKDEKNEGLYRKVVGGKISPRSLVAMSAGEMANKEL